MCMGNEHETPECSRNEPRDIDATSDLDQRANDVDAVCSRESSRTLNRTCLMCGGAPLHRDFGQRSVALAATGPEALHGRLQNGVVFLNFSGLGLLSRLLSDWPRPLRPTDDPHVPTCPWIERPGNPYCNGSVAGRSSPTPFPCEVLAIAQRTGRSSAQASALQWAGLHFSVHCEVLIRWALQLGLAVVFHADRRGVPGRDRRCLVSFCSVRVQHVRENLGALGFELPRREMQLISGSQAERPFTVFGGLLVSHLNSGSESPRVSV